MSDSGAAPGDPLTAIVSALSFGKGMSFLWFGELAFRVPARIGRTLAPGASANVLRAALEKHLYENFYLPGRACPFRRTPYTIDVGLDDRAFRRSLFEANAIGQNVEAGWRVLGHRGDRAILQGNGLRVQADRETLLARGDFPSARPEVGQAVTLRRPSAYSRLSPGYVAFRAGAGVLDDRIVRFYWNILPRAAAELVRTLTHLVGETGVPFGFKVLDNPASYGRCDAAVLYVRPEHVERITPAMREAHARVADMLRGATPALTAYIAKGLGAAEDPGDGRSFGMARCALLAQGLLDARQRGRKRTSLWLDALRERFDAAGLDIDRPSLGPGSEGAWLTPLGTWPRPRPRRRTSAVADPAALAEDMGAAIAKRSIWHDGQCTWMGAANELAKTMRDRRVAPLDGSLYDGAAGMALLFAELAAAGGRRDMRKTALGALRHAAGWRRSGPEPARLSAYTGAVGVAWVAACIAEVLNDDEARSIAAAMLEWMNACEIDDRVADLLTGAAGAALALLSLHRLGFQAEATPLLERCAERLVSTAEIGPRGACWHGSDAPSGRPGLTGFSHGSAGIACALAMLDAQVGGARCGELAREAVRYEQSFFDKSHANWPDLREARPGSVPAFTHYWCHGAPGIGLGRMSMIERIDWRDLADHARTAMDTTAAYVLATSEAPDEAHCLCHGLPGNALVLARGVELWPEITESRAWARAVDQTKDAMVAAYRPVSGSAGRNPGDAGTPGLMLGEGGIAYYFLSIAGFTRTRVLDLHEGFSGAVLST